MAANFTVETMFHTFDKKYTYIRLEAVHVWTCHLFFATIIQEGLGTKKWLGIL